MIDLNKKTILVTGASSGIGREAAILASALGAKLVITGRNDKELSLTFNALKKIDGIDHITILCDISRYEEVERLVNDVAQYGKLDGVVHCAGISITEPLRFISPESVDLIVDINLKSTVYLVSLLRKKRLFNACASVVLLSSVAALVGEQGIAAYAATKGATLALTKSFAAELAIPEKIRVNCLAPGIVKTALVEKKFEHSSEKAIQDSERRHLFGFADPKDVAEPIMFFLSEASRWITGSCLVVDGGYSLISGE